MDVNPKWLEILKASGWQTTAIAIACGIFILLAHIGALPELPALIFLLISFIGILCGCLAIASWCSAVYNFFPLHRWFIHWNKISRSKQGLVKYIPYMTEEERKIIAYLLAKNQKTFTAAADGGYAATLLSRGIVIVLAQHGQQLNMEDVPMTIPDPLWDVVRVGAYVGSGSKFYPIYFPYFNCKMVESSKYNYIFGSNSCALISTKY